MVGLILLAFAFRLYRLDVVPLRGDEAYSVMHWTATPFSHRWETLIKEEPAPVGAFTLYWVWNVLIGDSEFSTRYLSLLGNVVGLAAIIVVSRRLLQDWRLAYSVGLLWAVHPFLIWHAQDARVYGVLSALSPLAFYSLIRAVQEPDKPFAWRLYVIVQSAAIYIYYLEPLWLAAQGVFILSTRSQLILRHAAMAWIIIGLISLPVIAQLYHLMFVSNYEGTAEAAELSLIFSWFVPTLLFGQNTLPVGLGLVIALGLLAGLLLIHKDHAMASTLLIAWIFVPIVLLYGVSFFSNFFRPRYVMTVIPGLLVALVAIPVYLQQKQKYLGVGLIVILFVLVSVKEVRDYFVIDPPKAADWPGIMDYLETRTTAADLVLTGALDPAQEYYYSGNLAFIPPDAPDPTTYMPDLLTQHQTIFMLTGERTGDVGQFLQANAQHIPGDTWPGVVQYRRWEVEESEIAMPLNVQFGGVARLRGYTLVGDTTLLLYWEALGTTETEHSVFLHLVKGDSVHSLDHAIAGAVVSTRVWEPGIIYRDPVPLPANWNPPAAEIQVGLYETQTLVHISEVYAIEIP